MRVAFDLGGEPGPPSSGQRTLVPPDHYSGVISLPVRSHPRPVDGRGGSAADGIVWLTGFVEHDQTSTERHVAVC